MIDKPPSTTILLQGLMAFTVFLALAVVVNISLLVGSYYFPWVVLGGIVLPYMTYCLVLGNEERKDGAPWDSFRRNNLVFRAARRFLNLKVLYDPALVEADKQPGAQFILAVFPHGCNADHRILLDGMLHDQIPNTFHRLRSLAATVLFRIPIVREISLWTNCVDASRSVAERLLKNERSLLILPGGQAEQLRTEFGREKIYLNRRKGFIRLAVKHKVPVVPVYVFGCSDYYKTSNFLMGIRLALVKYTGIALPIAFGWGGHLLCPRPVDTTVVLGAPLKFDEPPIDDKSGQKKLSETEFIDQCHQKFCDALRELFDKHKESLGYGDRELEIF